MSKIESVTRPSQLKQLREIPLNELEELASVRFVQAWVQRLVYGDELNSAGINLANKVIFSSYMDLVRLGFQEEVEQLKEVAFEKAKKERDKYLQSRRNQPESPLPVKVLTDEEYCALTLERLGYGAELVRNYVGQLDEPSLGLLKYFIFINYADAVESGIQDNAPALSELTIKTKRITKKDVQNATRKLPSFSAASRKQMALRSLERGVRLMNEYGDQLNEQGLQLLKRMIFSDYVDACSLKVKGKADKLLRNLGRSGE